ncbi:hypothetical protein D9V32_13545 [Mycetocola tolaasinivorans]|uniref:Uncharacterized protein n=1 Tax=Mycetocola tolaasinivorans TaxID=76635 RepID=A0A3L7A2I8_9MICO|nr:hypothetical protein [Mycetocola tolaasinivorans]RLP74367.1 hypothetical protein D9V32_13545 [Mycetocola tolaasinivorans]
MAELSAQSRETLTDHYKGQIRYAANNITEHHRAIERIAELADDLGISDTEREADYQAALAKYENLA